MVLHAIHGPDGRDRSVAADPFHWEPRRPLGAMRVGVLQKAFDNMRAAEKPVYAQALADLKKAGVMTTARVTGQTLGAVFVAIVFEAGGTPTAALLIACSCIVIAAILSSIRLRAQVAFAP